MSGDSIFHIDALRAGFAAAVDNSRCIDERGLRAINEGQWPHGMIPSGQIQYGGFYGDYAPFGLLFGVSVLNCQKPVRDVFAKGECRLGFFRDRDVCRFLLEIHDGDRFDLPFVRGGFDVGANAAVSAARDGLLKHIKICFVDGAAIVAQRNGVLDAKWVKRLGRELQNLPTIFMPSQA